MEETIRYLAFGGTGVRNPGYAGALMALEERNLYQNVRGFSGTSAGSIVAALAGVGYTPSEIVTQLIDPLQVWRESGWLGPLNLIRRFGWYDTQNLAKVLGDFIADKIGDPLASIPECESKTGNKIRIVTTNLSTGQVRVFPDPELPNIPLVKAVQMSVSIPLFFMAQRLGDDLYVDGGVAWNMPVEIFDVDGQDPGTLGFVVKQPPRAAKGVIRFPLQYAVALAASLGRGQSGSQDYRAAQRGRVIEIDGLGISPVDFGSSAAQKWALIDAGRRATNRFLDARLDAAAAARPSQAEDESSTWKATA